MLNIGVPGDNLPSHVTLVAGATKEFAPDIGFLSFARWAAGPGFSAWIWTLRPQAGAVGPAERKMLRRERDRLAAARSAGSPQPLLVYPFLAAEQAILAAPARGTRP